MADRVDTAVVDLEQPLGTLAAAGAADVVWASMVLHHVASLPATLAEIRGVLAPGGVLALVEFGDERRALPEHAVPERPGFVERHADVTRELLAAHLPAGALEIDWPSALVAAGLEVVTHRRVVMERPAPLDAGERAFAKHSLEMAAHVGLHRFDDLDLLTLARLLDDDHPMSVVASRRPATADHAHDRGRPPPLTSWVPAFRVTRRGEWRLAPRSIGDGSWVPVFRVARCGEWRLAPRSIGDGSWVPVFRVARCGEWRLAPRSIGNGSWVPVFRVIRCGEWRLAPRSIGNGSWVPVFRVARCGEWRLAPRSIGDGSWVPVFRVARCGEWRLAPRSMGDVQPKSGQRRF
ncbi:MAG: methyltransferase domain-containing protein [Ilumatobacteraceae bacterium]